MYSKKYEEVNYGPIQHTAKYSFPILKYRGYGGINSRFTINYRSWVQDLGKKKNLLRATSSNRSCNMQLEFDRCSDMNSRTAGKESK